MAVFIFLLFLFVRDLSWEIETQNPPTIQLINASTVLAPANSSSSLVEAELHYRRELIRNMTRESWHAYRQYAWGHGILKPVTRQADHSWFGKNSGWTIVAAMSTLKVMGLEEEFQEGKTWIKNELKFGDIDRDVLVMNAVLHYLGGLLSCYALTGDEIFLKKAREISDLLQPAFNTTTGLLYETINPKEQMASDNVNYLYAIGHRQPEFIYLADLTNNGTLKAQLRKIEQFMKTMSRPRGLLLNSIHTDFDFWTSNTASLDSTTIEFFFNLLRSYRISNGTDVESLKLYSEALQNMTNTGMFRVHESGWTLASEYDLPSSSFSNELTYGACDLGAMLALGGRSLERLNATQAAHHLTLARQLTETCQMVKNATKKKLPPLSVQFVGTQVQIKNSRFHLSAELAYSYLILWRLTHDNKYRDYAWQLLEAIREHCGTESGGYSNIEYVDDPSPSKSDYQGAVFLSATLKYLYLIFSEDTVLPLEKWVFNTKGHPLPVCGEHRLYPLENCRRTT